MPFAGEECLGKLRNEDKKAFDILCRRRGAGLVQQRCRIIKQARKKKETQRKERKRGRLWEEEDWTKLHAPSGGRWAVLSAHRGEDRMKSSALTLNYGPVARMALQKSGVDWCPVSHWAVSLFRSLTCRAAAAGLPTSKTAPSTGSYHDLNNMKSGTHRCCCQLWYTGAFTGSSGFQCCGASLSESYHVQSLILAYFHFKEISFALVVLIFACFFLH